MKFVTKLKILFKNPFLVYTDKFDRILKILTDFLTNYVDFVIFDDKVIDSIENINELANCLGLSKKICHNKTR